MKEYVVFAAYQNVGIIRQWSPTRIMKLLAEHDLRQYPDRHPHADKKMTGW